MTSVVSRAHTANGGPIPLTKSLSSSGPTTPAKGPSHKPNLSGSGLGLGHNGHGSATAEGTSSSPSGIPTLNCTNPAPGSSVLDTHRRNHSSSKLPAYRFADLKKKESGSSGTGSGATGGGSSNIPSAAAPAVGLTSNPRLGIVGGVSKIGAVGSGIVSGARARGSSSPTSRSNSKRDSTLLHGSVGGSGAKTQTTIGLPAAVLQNHIPPSPVSPKADSDPRLPRRGDEQGSRGFASGLNLEGQSQQLHLQAGTTPTPQKRLPTNTNSTTHPRSCTSASGTNNTSSSCTTNSRTLLAVSGPNHPNSISSIQLLDAPPSSSQTNTSSLRSRASTFQSPATTTATKRPSESPSSSPSPSPPDSSTLKRPVSYPESPSISKPIASAAARNNNSPPATFLAPAAPSLSASSPTTHLVRPKTATTPTTPTNQTTADSLTIDQPSTAGNLSETQPADRGSAHDQHHRELLLAKPLRPGAQDHTQEAATVAPSSVISNTTPTAPPSHRSNSDDRRASRRPPVSFKPPLSTSSSASPASGRAVIPPIRAFRSSGSRRSLVLDMNTRNSRSYDFGDDSADSNHRDRTLRALEGRDPDDSFHRHPTPPDSATRDRSSHGDDGGDMFLRIAREEFARKSSDEGREGSTVSRVTRTSHGRRPYSAAVPSYQPTSPPRISRRLSDQQETKRSRAYDDDRTLDVMPRSSAYRETMDRLASASEQSRSRSSAQNGPPKSNPVTPRTLSFQDGVSDNPPAYNRRRGSITDSNANISRPPYKNSSLSYSRTYNSSPLVPKPEVSDTNHGFESTESTASTNAPSMMWDEVDKMKSQIERIQKKGTLPANSAVSRGSDERPPTAATTVTTMSTSPKRVSGNATQAMDASSTTSSHKEPHPILQAALYRTRPVVTPEVYRALEVAANDAMALAGMMGSAGQPGPISSGASSIGNGMTVTDRQLRRKADSVCRSLTELCIALSDGNNRKSPPIVQTVEPNVEREAIMSPTVTTFLSAPPTRRPSAVEPNLNLSPRNVSRLEERRNNMMNSAAIPSPRLLPNAPTDTNGTGRKSSLLISRTRRAGTEEPEDGRRSSLLRTRRAGTEEPEEGRKSSLFVRSRRNTIGDEDDESRFRAPSRANTTELAALRALNREREAAVVADTNLATSALPRRRLAPSALGTSSRLAAPASTPATSRRYLDRTTPDRETVVVADRSGEERGQRQYIRPTGFLGRSGSLSRRNRDSTLSGLTVTPTANGYR